MTASKSSWIAGLMAATLACLAGCQTMSSWLPKHDKVTDARANASAKDTALSTNITPEQRLNVEFAVAQSLEEENQSEDAAKIYRNLAKNESQSVNANQHLGLLYAKRGDWDQAQKYFEIALKKAPKNADLHCDLGYTFYLQRRDVEAEQQFRQAIGLEPNFNRAHNDLGLIFARRGQENDSLKEFAAAGCTEAQAHANLAMAYAVENRLAEARAQYQIALSADPNLAIATRGLAALSSVDKNLAQRRKAEEAKFEEVKLTAPYPPGAF